MTLHVPDLTSALPSDDHDLLDVDGCDFTVRQLTSRDIAAASTAKATDAADVLRTRLTLPTNPPAKFHPVIDAAIEARATDNELSTTLECTACNAVWREVLDIADLLWTEIETAAIALLGEVAEIAAALGWSERDILALPAVRRQVYLSLARQS